MQVSVNIIANASKAIEELGRVKTKTTDLEKGLKKLSTNIGTFGNIATKGITVPMVAAVSAMGLATNEAMKFNKSMAEVSTLLNDTSKEDFESFRKEVLQFSSTMGIASEQVVPALYQAISAGIPQENVLSFLEVASQASIAGVTNLQTSVDGLTSVINAYGQDTISVNRASDLMFTTVKLGKTNFNELSKSLYNVIPTASSLGVSFEDVSAALATITVQGTPTKVATTQLRQALVELSKEGSKTDLIFRDLSGVSFRDFISSGGDLQSALQLLEQNANKTGKSISDSFSSVEAGNAVLQLTGKATDSFSSSLNEMSKAANATNIAFQKMELDESRQFEKLKVEITNLVIELGQNLVPIVSENLLPLFKDTLIPIAESLVKKIGELATMFNSLPTPVKNASIAFAAMVAAIGPVALGLSTLIGGLANTKAAVATLTSAWKLLNSTMLLSPVGIIVTLTAVLAACVIQTQLKAKADEDARKAAIANAEAILKQKEAIAGQEKETKKLVSQYTKLADKAKLTSKEQKEFQTTINKLKEIYPDLNIAIDENGKAMLTNIGIVYDEIAALKEKNILKEQEARLELEASLAKQEAKLKEQQELAEEYEKNPNGGGSYWGGLDNSTRLITLNKNIDTTKEKIKETQELLNKLEKNNPTVSNNDTTTNPQIEALNKKIALLEKQLELQNKNNDAENNSNTDDKKDFDSMVLSIQDNIKAYEKEIAIRQKLGEVIQDSEINSEKSDIARSGILEIVEALELTEEQILQLKDEFGSLFETINKDGQTAAEYFKDNWANICDELLDITGDFIDQYFDYTNTNLQNQIDALDTKKTIAIQNIEDELNAYLEANEIMEATEAERLKESIAELQERQKIALGLYEQERIRKELEEAEAALQRELATEESEAKILEIEKYYTNEQIRLQHKQDVANWQNQLIQATVSTAQAIINAVNSAMTAGPGALVMTPILTGMAAALTASQLAVIANNKPAEPTYLATGGLIQKRVGGINAVIGEGNFNEAVIPLKTDVLASIGNAIVDATDSASIDDNSNIEVEYNQPILLNVDGRTIGNIVLNLSKRGVKVVHSKGII